MMGHAEAALLSTMGLGLTDPTALTEAGLREEEGSVVAVEVEVAKVPTATEMQHPITKVPRKATWEATMITSRLRHKGIITRTATTMLPTPGSTVTLLVVMTRIMGMKVRLRVPSEFLRSYRMA